MNRVSARTAYRAAAALALATTALLIWLSLGVGIIGRDGEPANLVYAFVLAVGVVAAALARLRALGMARALLAMALVQALVAAFAVITGLGAPYSGPLELVFLNGLFVMLFVGSALLFGRAARG